MLSLLRWIREYLRRIAARTSHLLQQPTQHVTLILWTDPSDRTLPEWHRVRSDGGEGTSELQPFSVPPKHFLVVTDVEWQLGGSDPSAPVQTLYLRLVNTSDGRGPYNEPPVFASTIYPNQGYGGSNVAMTAGFTVSAQTVIYPMVLPGPFPVNLMQANVPSALAGQPPFGQWVILHGYLIPET